jgi:hypothetical protein
VTDYCVPSNPDRNDSEDSNLVVCTALTWVGGWIMKEMALAARRPSCGPILCNPQNNEITIKLSNPDPHL